MRSVIFYKVHTNNKNKPCLTGRKVKGHGYIYGLFLAGILLMSISVQANPVPATIRYVHPGNQYDTICANGPVDISYLLSVTDFPGDKVIWAAEFGSPYHGSISGLPVDSVIVPSSDTANITGVTYTPTTGYSGNDGLIIKVSDNLGNTSIVRIHFKINPQPSIVLGANPSICAGNTSASISYSGLTNIEADTFNFTSNATWAVPVGVLSLNFDVQGARGGADNATPVPEPGAGGRIQGVLSVNPGQNLYLYVGGEGGPGSATGAAGGYNGGASTSFYVYGSGGGGGGASDIRIGGTALANRVVVAGGGGGSGYDGSSSKAGGVGGGLIGGNSASNSGGTFAGGGTQTTGGAGDVYTFWTPGSNGSLGNGGAGSTDGISGGGGGGYYGGGGGVWTGGGGGSSYADAGLTSGVINTQGYDTSNGHITLSYVIPGTYSILWNTAAHTAGFRDTTSVAMPTTDAGTITMAIPNIIDTTVAVTYTGTLTVSTSTCISPAYPISVTIKPIPVVHVPNNQAFCNGDTTLDIFLSSSVISDTVFWSTSNTTIGLPATSGINKIAKFVTTNSTTEPSVAIFTLTPTAIGCPGTPETFTITDNPIPQLGSTPTPAPVCYGNTFSYTQTPVTPGTTFTWSRAAVTGVSNTNANGSGNISELLVDTINSPVSVIYEDTMNFMGCINVQPVTVSVYPLPKLTNSLTPPDVCSGTSFIDTATTNVIGTIVTWSRPATTGISNIAAAGNDSIINEILLDTTTAPVTVVYTDTLNYNGCYYQNNVTVTLNPTPVLTSSPIGLSTCDTVNYTAMSSITPGTTFAWSRDSIGGISNSAGSGANAIIYEGLTNTTPNPVVVTYVYTLTAYGCSNPQRVTDTVKPTPVLSNPVPMPDSLCNNVIFGYTAMSATSGTAFAWYRSTVTGISNPADSAISGIISEILINDSTATIPVTYVYTLTAAGCVNTQNVVININPTPQLNNVPIDTLICDNTLFTYTPGSATGGASYAWTIPYVPGINSFASSGTGSISVTLDNTTYVNVLDTFEYTITANGCSNTQDIIFTVSPNPTLSSDSVETTCSGVAFIYYPSSYTPATTFAWSLASVTGITPSSTNGSGLTLSDSLTSSLSTDTSVVFVYTLTVNGCTNTQNVTVTVNPAPTISNLTTFAPNAACDNTMYQNFGTSIAPPTGYEYSWQVDNAQLYATGANNQYALINFNNPGTATIYLYVNNLSTLCTSNAGYQVTVSSTQNTSPDVIYVNGEFICKSNTADHYQWGYDDVTTLDSSMIAGETNQNYFNANIDVASKYYWVMTTNGDCIQKSYYNTPLSNVTGVVNVNNAQDGIKVYPNPAAENINVDIQATAGSNFRIEVLNILGQSISTIRTTDHSVKIDVSGMPAGCYMVDCYNDGVKIATAKFIKN